MFRHHFCLRCFVLKRKLSPRTNPSKGSFKENRVFFLKYSLLKYTPVTKITDCFYVRSLRLVVETSEVWTFEQRRLLLMLLLLLFLLMMVVVVLLSLVLALFFVVIFFFYNLWILSVVYIDFKRFVLRYIKLDRSGRKEGSFLYLISFFSFTHNERSSFYDSFI